MTADIQYQSTKVYLKELGKEGHLVLFARTKNDMITYSYFSVEPSQLLVIEEHLI